ncbi:hypothetical protein [Effusibacillus dendaii]|uniref:Uncharacterized protein n=1 Tax=Effusibacillus dendaii TaxID=2743772 RepID=A0A7I8D8X6_9BACL|nr:hypothetical protein [Effusibacillus dendaii]BCJ86593.1 hypothetical protein skT53_15780 [Effusibacillus dendaii]
MLLFIALVLITLIMIVSMAMSIVSIRAEKTQLIGKIWIGLSCLSVCLLIGTSYVMISEVKQSDHELTKQQSNQDATVQQSEPEVETAPKSTPESNIRPTEAASSYATTPSSSGQSVEYLVEILEALKKGQPIPEHYLNQLPPEDRKRLENLR